MSDLSTPLPPASPLDDSPLGTRWTQWTLYAIVNGSHLTPEERRLIIRARRRRARWQRSSALPVVWSVGPGDGTRLPNGPGLTRDRRHAHASVVVAGRALHIDAVYGLGGSPGYSYALAHLYVDGRLVDERTTGGSSLGFTVWGAMAIAPVSRRLAVGVDPRQFYNPGPPDVWLMTREALEQRVEP